MAALTVILTVMNPPLAWARDTPTQVSALEQRMSYHGMGEGREEEEENKKIFKDIFENLLKTWIHRLRKHISTK